MNYGAIDCHANNWVIVITDDSHRVHAARRLPNDLPPVLEFLAPYKIDLAGLTVESTYSTYYWFATMDGKS